MAEEIDRTRHVVTPPPATTMAAELDVARFYQRLGAIHSAFAKHRCVVFFIHDMSCVVLMDEDPATRHGTCSGFGGGLAGGGSGSWE